MTDHILTTWLLTYVVHGALFAALAAVVERTGWGAVASRRDAFWKLALIGGIATSTVFVAAGSAPGRAAVYLSPQGVVAPALTSDGAFWLATAWVAITSILAARTVRAWRVGMRHVGRRRVIRRGRAHALLQEILGAAADRVTLSCSRTLRVPLAFAREICVPLRALRELPDDELRALLAHEAAHVVRRDAVWLMIAAAVRALGWWQPLNLLAASRLRLAMELCCDERAAAEPSERAALARCLIKVAEWTVQNRRPEFAAMTSRGSALRRRLESLLDDAPRRRRRVAPWVAVTTVAAPAVWLVPVVTIADVSHVPAAAVRVAREAQPPVVTIARGVPSLGRTDRRRAVRSWKAAAGPPIAMPTDSAAVLEMPIDAPLAAADSTPDRPGLQLVEVLPDRPNRLRDAITKVRFIADPVPWRTRLEGPDRAQRVLSRIVQRIGFDITRPKLDVPDPGRNALSRAQQIAFDTVRDK